MILNQFAQQTPNPAMTLDFGYLAVVLVALGLAGTTWVYANSKLSNFNKENGEKKKDTEEQLNKDIYRRGTAPLVMAVNSYVSEQVIANFSIEEQEIIEKFETQKINCIDPTSPSFIDLSNFTDTTEYDQKVKILIDSHRSIRNHEENYILMKKNLRKMMYTSTLPFLLFSGSIILHIMDVIFIKNSETLSNYAQTLLIIGALTLISVAYFYLRYMRYVRLLDNTTEVS